MISDLYGFYMGQAQEQEKLQKKKCPNCHPHGGHTEVPKTQALVDRQGKGGVI